MRSKSQIISKLRADGHITDEEYKMLEQEPCKDMVSRGVFEQVMWERDVAIGQLKKLGYEFGEKIEPCDDVINCADKLLDLANAIENDDSGYWINKRISSALRNISSIVEPSLIQKSGKWIVHEKPHGIRYLECPYCNIWYLNEHLIRNSYCPNCGAKMLESEE